MIRETIQSQYANSPRLLTLIEEFTSVINQDTNVEQFKKLIWNIHTAKGIGLDIWGRIVGVNRNIKVADNEGEFFGFTLKFTPFNDAPFSGQGAEFGSFRMKDSDFRELIMIKAFANIVYATAPNINRFLNYLFKDRGRATFLITGHMQANYYFDFILSPLEKKMIYELNLLPRPCGVFVGYMEINSQNTFGFDKTGYQPFDIGTFA